MGAFEKGHKKIGGRKAGTKNKATTEQRARIARFFEAHWDEFENDIWPYLPLKDKKDTFIAMLNYNYPKLTSVDMKQETKADTSALDLIRQMVDDNSIV